MAWLRVPLALLALTLSTIAWAAPTPEPPTAAEWAKLEKGEIVTRAAPDLSPPGAYGWAIISAEPDAVWATLNDPQVAVDSGGSVSSCEKYVDEPNGTSRKIGLHYVLTVAWTDVSYYVLRELRTDEGWMTWTLDPAKTSDIVSTQGSYVLSPGKTPGTLLLTYQTQTDSGRQVPQWLSQMLTGKALKGYLDHVKKIAESK